MPHVEIFTVDRFGDNWYSHPDAYATDSVVEELNQTGSFSIAIPNNDPNVGNAKEHAREIQLWLNGNLTWQGKITAKNYDPEQNVWVVDAEGPLTYFKDLHVGRAGRVNWLVNGSFDTGDLTGWTPIGVTANAVTAWGALPGTTYQANLYQAGAGEDTFIQQLVVVPGGTYWTLAAWFHIRTDSQWVGPAFDERGLFVERRHPDTNEVEDVAHFAITEDTPRGIFHRATVNMWSPPSRDSHFWVRLYSTRCTAATGSPPGSIIWDAVQLVAPESLSYPHQDVGAVINGLVSHGQDDDFGKTDLHITPGASNIGILVDRFYQFEAHLNIYDEMMSFAEAGLCDIQCVTSWDNTNQRADRHIRAWAPQQGEFKALALELDAASGVSEMGSIEMDGSKTRTTVIALGDGSGPEREEAFASDTSLTDGVVIEDIMQVDSSVHHDLLAGVAQHQVALFHGVPQVPALVLSPDLTDLVNCGDSFPTVLDIGGPLEVVGNYRVVRTELDVETYRKTVQVVEI